MGAGSRQRVQHASLLAATAALLWLGASTADAAQRRVSVPIPLDSGRVLEAQLRMPADSLGPQPVVMLFGGFRGAATVLDAVPADLPLIAASFDYPFDPPRRFRFSQSFGDLPALARGIDETFEGIAKLTTALRARDDVDATRMTIVGASLGAPFAITAADRLDLPGVVIAHGFAELRRVIAHQFIRKLEPRYGAWTRAPAWGLANALVWGFGLPVTERHAAALRKNQRALMIVAEEDELIPRAATDTLWAALQESQARVQRDEHPGPHLQGSDDPRIAELVASALTWMRRVDLR